MNKKELRLLMFATFRYSLGRRTDMPSFITDLIIKNNELFHKQDWKKFVEEINDANDLGDSCDIQTWNRFLHFCQSKSQDK